MCEKSDHTLLYAAGVERSILERGLVEEELEEEEKVEEENVAKVDEEVDEEMRKVTTPCMPVVGIDRYWRGAGAQEGEGVGGIGTLQHSQFVSKCSSGNDFFCLSLGNKPRKHKINYTWGGCWLLGRGRRWQGVESSLLSLKRSLLVCFGFGFKFLLSLKILPVWKSGFVSILTLPIKIEYQYKYIHIDILF